MTKLFKFRHFALRQNHSPFPITSDAVTFACWICFSKSEGHCVDVGAGTGLLTCILRHRFPSWQFYCIEKHPGAAEDCIFNVASLGIPVNHLACQDFLLSWPQHWPQRFDALVCNPPFYLNDLPNPKAEVAQTRHANTKTAQRLCEQLAFYLSAQGDLYMLLPARYVHNFLEWLADYDLHPRSFCMVKSTPHKTAHVAMVHLKKGKFSGCHSQELLICDDQGRPTSDYKTLVGECYAEDYFLRWK
ncbi:MAG: methyltransferase [Flavobacteriales bacterium]|nr:methyltransferase [Flavobacteriales bacterium]MDW8410452.1 methyltransferase [Flavobacteriales bacterium]